MSETPPFTAEDVRECLEGIDCDADLWLHHARAMLDAFAQRLEQEEGQQHAFAATEGAAYAIVPHGAAEALREEGRREIFREIATLDDPAIDGSDYCVFCEADIDDVTEKMEPHRTGCLWLRAQEAAK